MKRRGTAVAKCALVASALLAVHAAPALADDVVRYRLPDGSIGFAQPGATLPPGATVVHDASGSKGTVSTAAPSPKPESRSRSTDLLVPLRDRPKPPPAASPSESGPSAEDKYAEERRKLREDSARAKRDADDVKCRDRGSEFYGGPHRGYDCSGREIAQRKAEETAQDNERKRAKLIDDCMQDDDCEPRLIRDE